MRASLGSTGRDEKSEGCDGHSAHRLSCSRGPLPRYRSGSARNARGRECALRSHSQEWRCRAAQSSRLTEPLPYWLWFQWMRPKYRPQEPIRGGSASGRLYCKTLFALRERTNRIRLSSLNQCCGFAFVLESMFARFGRENSFATQSTRSRPGPPTDLRALTEQAGPSCPLH